QATCNFPCFSSILHRTKTNPLTAIHHTPPTPLFDMNRTSSNSNGAGGIVLQPQQHFSINDLIHQYQHFSLSNPQTSPTDPPAPSPPQGGDREPSSPSARSFVHDLSVRPNCLQAQESDQAGFQRNLPIPTEATTRSETWGATNFEITHEIAPSRQYGNFADPYPTTSEPTDNASKTLTIQEALYLEQRRALLMQPEQAAALEATNTDPALLRSATGLTSGAFPASSLRTFDDGIHFTSSTLPLIAELGDDDMATENPDPDGYGGELSFLMNDLVMGEADAEASSGLTHGHMPYCM
ncbi:hypothetical protein BC936DRAFT_138550, partial [Jimgerdemannia flammicorona]